MTPHHVSRRAATLVCPPPLPSLHGTCTHLPDVVVRQDLLMWLQKETETRGATIIYATHIFDGLDSWPTHIHYLHYHGHTGWQGRLEEHEYYMELRQVCMGHAVCRVPCTECA